jgi:hypothetical protein
MSIKEWDKLMDSIDKELETIHEALLEKEEKQSEKEQEERIRKLFEDRNANEEMGYIGLRDRGEREIWIRRKSSIS